MPFVKPIFQRYKEPGVEVYEDQHHVYGSEGPNLVYGAEGPNLVYGYKGPNHVYGSKTHHNYPPGGLLTILAQLRFPSDISGRPFITFWEEPFEFN